MDLRVRESAFTLTYELRAGDPQLHMRVQGTWFERGTHETGVPVLAAAFPLALRDARARYEVPFGAVDRDLHSGEEVPALQWAQVTGEAGGQGRDEGLRPGGVRAGCLLVNDSKHGHALDGSTLRLTLIRGSYDPDPLPEIGQHEIRLALMPFADELAVADATRRGCDLNHPLRIVGTDVHEGKLPAQAQFASVGPDNLIVSTVKKAEDENALVVRVYETAGQQTTARIRFDRKLLGKVSGAREVDLLERPVAKSAAKVSGNVVTVAVPPFGIASVKVKFAR